MITLLDRISGVDGAALERALRAELSGEVRFDIGSRAMYSTDASNYRFLPIGVVLPRDADDAARGVAVCRRFAVPVLSRGGGTSLAGSTCNDAVVLDFSKYMHGVLEIDWEHKRARVQPGCVTDDLKRMTLARGLVFGPDPATHENNTFGGMIGNNSCGTHAHMAGKCAENIDELEILTYDGLRMRVGSTTEEELLRIIAQGDRRGDIYRRLLTLRNKYADLIRLRFPDIPRRVSGYGLDWLLPENGFNVARALVGTESTCVTVLEATCRLVDFPPYRALAILGYEDLAAAGDDVARCDQYHLLALEAFDEMLLIDMEKKGMSTANRALLPQGHAWLMAEFGGATREEAEERARELRGGRVIADPQEQARLWEMREAALPATAKVPNESDYYPGWEDAAVAPARLGDYLRKFQPLMREYGYSGALYGHFGQGCIHCSINFDLFTREGIAKYRAFVTKAAHLCVEYGGSLSGEHGDGQARGELLPIMYGDELVNAFWEFKCIWDPQNRMNPGKVVHARKLDEDLRWGPDYEPHEPKTHFTFPDDHGSFAYAANRCVGTGKCRKHDRGTMCPSYMATKEEAYSTRGRARLLFELLAGTLPAGWQDERVKDALDFCLACKACKSECPVNVDMATYKAEFLSHYYEKRRRPLSAYAFGLMMLWARAASWIPWLANALSHAPLLGSALKHAIGMAPQRQAPLFAQQSFRRWFSQRAPRNRGAQRVILWPDTWNMYFHPETLQAAVHVLEDAGFYVTIPRKSLCCGRPLYDYGMLDTAKRMLRATLEELRDAVRHDVYVVGLEPSCVSVFRDELTNLLGNDEDARRLAAHALLLSEFLAHRAPEYRTPKLVRRALVHQHCHHKSVLEKETELQLLRTIGLECDVPDTGCCGMAGAYGFERNRYDVSMAVGERVLLPSVRNADDEMLIVADGYSCREQIAQSTVREALHPVEVLHMAIVGAPARHDPLPERRYRGDSGARREQAARTGAALLVALTALAAIGAVCYASRR